VETQVSHAFRKGLNNPAGFVTNKERIMWLIIGKAVLGNLEEEIAFSWNSN
jgi:hypothetical protein